MPGTTGNEAPPASLDDAPLLPPTRLEFVQLPSLGSKDVYRVLPASSKKIVGDELRAICDDISIMHGANPLMSTYFVVPVLSGIVGSGVTVKPGFEDAWNERAPFWSSPVALPGSAKTPVQHAVLEALRLVQYIVNKLAARRGKQPVVLAATSKTLEHLADSLRVSADKVAIFVIDELSGFLASVGQYKSGAGAEADMGVLLELRNGGGIIDSTLGRGTTELNMTHVAICGGLQPSTFKKVLGSRTAYDTGFAGRFAVGVLPPGEKCPEAVKQLREHANSAESILSRFDEKKMSGIMAMFDAKASDDMKPTAVRLAGSSKSRGSRQSIAPGSNNAMEDESVEELPTAAEEMLDCLSSALDSKSSMQHTTEYLAERLQKRQRLVTKPVQGLALILLETYYCMRGEDDSRFVPSLEVLALDDDVDENYGMSPYKAFNAFCGQVQACTTLMTDRGLDGQAGVLNKMPGQVLQLCGILHPTYYMIHKMMGDAASSIAMPTKIGMDILISAMDFVRLSTLQRFMLLDDTSALACMRELVSHIQLAARLAAGVVGRVRAADGPDGNDDNDEAEIDLPLIWRKAVQQTFVGATSNKDALKHMAKLKELFAEEHCAPGCVPTTSKPMMKWEPSKFCFGLSANALTSSKLLVSGSGMGAVTSMVREVLRGSAGAVEYVFMIAEGKANAAKEGLMKAFQSSIANDHEFADHDLHINELELPLPAICEIKSIGNIKVPMKILPAKQDSDPVSEYNQYMTLKKNLMVYGIMLDQWSQVAAQRFKVVEDRFKKAQDDAQQLVQGAASQQLAMSLQEKGSQSIGGVTMGRGGNACARGSLSGMHMGAAATPGYSGGLQRRGGARGAADVNGSPMNTPGVESIAPALNVAAELTHGMPSQ